MARPLRIKYEGAFYHITARGNERKKIFFAKSDYAKFKEYLKEAQDRYGHFLHCYVLMSNHYHLILETPNADISKIMHYINGSYAGYINRRRRRSGHHFQGRYRSIPIDMDSYSLELSRYVHLNPVGDLFGGLSFTAVSKANQRFMMRMKKDRKLRRNVDDILRNMSHVKGPSLMK